MGLVFSKGKDNSQLHSNKAEPTPIGSIIKKMGWRLEALSAFFFRLLRIFLGSARGIHEQPVWRGHLIGLSIHPPKQTWNLKIDPWKRRFLLETIISRFHVNFWGCTSLWFKIKNTSFVYQEFVYTSVGHWNSGRKIKENLH